MGGLGAALRLTGSKRFYFHTKMSVSRHRLRSKSCADSAGVSDGFPTGKSRSHNPLVLGSNPSGPTNQINDSRFALVTDTARRRVEDWFGETVRDVIPVLSLQSIE